MRKTSQILKTSLFSIEIPSQSSTASVCIGAGQQILNRKLSGIVKNNPAASTLQQPVAKYEWASIGGVRYGTTYTGAAAQQVRKYAPFATDQATKCWNCQQVTEQKHQMLCGVCGHLQDADMNMNYFELLNFPQTFKVQAQELTQRFRQLQTLVHPDKFSNRTSREQTNSADWSSLINKAYKTLLVPIDRGLYMLKLYGLQIPEDNSTLDKEFLMDMMERNEQVEEAVTKDELQQLSDQISVELNEKVEELNKLFEQNKHDEATAVLVKMKYLLSIQNSIKNKQQLFMGTL